MSDEQAKKERARQRRIGTARELEGRGFLDQAVREYLKAGAPEEAARALAAAGRLADAANAILEGAGVSAEDAGKAAPQHRELLLSAAVFLEQTGDSSRARAIREALAGASSSGAARESAPAAASAPPAAVRGSFRAPAPAPSGSFRRPERPPSDARSESIRAPSAAPRSAAAASVAAPSRPRARGDAAKEPRLGASGEVITEYAGSREAGWRGAGADAIDESIRQMLAAGRKGAAARIAWDAGRHEQALEWFLELDLHYQAGACLRALGRHQEALETLLRVPIDGPHYRKACCELVPCAKALTRIDFDVDRFLARFVEQGPDDVAQVPVFLDLAELYRSAGFLQGATRCVSKVLALDPANARAAAVRAELAASSERARPSAAPAAARGLPELPTLEEFVRLARANAPRG